MVCLTRTETLALLEELLPEKLAPAATYAFTLVLVSVPPQIERRLILAVSRACVVSEADAEKLLFHRLPVELKNKMTYADAAIGQFELLACDALSLIVADRVIQNPPPGYVADLCKSLATSSDFDQVEVALAALPAGEKAREFLDLFLGNPEADLSQPRIAMRRKALLMQIMAARIGGRVLMSEIVER